jgi:large subunit ribosomal protein L19
MNKATSFTSKTLGDNRFKGIKSGWTVKVFQKIKEGEKTRTQAFEGTVIARKHGDTPSGTITIRKTTGGFGVEKVFPIFLPTIEKVEVTKKSKVRRAKIYYLRDKTAKEIRKKVKHAQIEIAAPETAEDQPKE